MSMGKENKHRNLEIYVDVIKYESQYKEYLENIELRKELLEFANIIDLGSEIIQR